jgi:hypothetical protein
LGQARRHLLGLVLTLSQLFEHHLPFHGEVVAVQARLQHQIQQQRQRLAGCFRWDQHVEVHVVEAGGGVAAAPQGLNAAIELARRQLAAALEHHVLQKMGHAGFGGRFAGAASPAPEIEAHHGSLRQIQLHQGYAVPESLPLRLRQRAARQSVGQTRGGRQAVGAGSCLHSAGRIRPVLSGCSP